MMRIDEASEIVGVSPSEITSSIASVGRALAAYPVGVERGFLTRADAVVRTLTTLRYFWNSPQGTEPDAMGYKGFFYHFLDMDTGRRTFLAGLAGGAACAWPAFGQDQPREIPFPTRIAMGAELRAQKPETYDPAYGRIAYPMGDVPADKGTCTTFVYTST